MQPLSVRITPVTPFQQNCSVVTCTATKDTIVVDPGGDVDKLEAAIAQNGGALKAIWLTHGHLDHAGGAAELKRRTGVPIIGPHKDDKFWLDGIPEHGAKYGWTEPEACEPDQWLEDGQEISVGKLAFTCVHCPGHTPGHIVFVNPALKLAFVGDVLFQGSIGRTDFPKGNHADLIASITEKLWPFGEDIQFVPGHGPMSTFGQERATNPHVSDAALARAGNG